MQVKLEKKPKAVYTLTITVPVEEVKKAYEAVVDELVKDADVNGFRKGTAPREIVLEKADTAKLHGEVVNELLQKFYPQALKEKSVSPVSNPKVEIKEFSIDKDFEFIATVATKPEVKFKDYKKELKKAHEDKNKKQSEENAEKLKKGEQIGSDHTHLIPNEIIDTLLKNSEVEVAEMLTEDEADRMLSRLVNQAQAIGMSLEQYLKSQNKTGEDLRKDYLKIAETTLKAEFILAELVKKENIQITEDEIDATIKATGDEKLAQKMQNSMERWYIKSVLEKNALISKLIEEAEGENAHANHK